jgi:hypothetical protein
MERNRWTARLAWGLCVATLLCVAVAIGLVVLNREFIVDLESANVLEIVLPLGFAILGGMVASRQPGNALGWAFLTLSLCQAIPGPTDQYTLYALSTNRAGPAKSQSWTSSQFAANATVYRHSNG